MKKDRQLKTPFFTKLKDYGVSGVTPFDLPGHKLGRVKNDLSDFIGLNTFLLDSNSPIGLDSLAKPTGVIKEAQALFAEACGADRCYFLTNGTSSGNIAMIMSTCNADDKIILPRNVHKSVINGLILSGAWPVFIKPEIDRDFGITMGVTFESVKETIDANPDAVAILIINPTYFGNVSDLESICNYAHEHNMVVLVDEAHGSQFYFCDKLPLGAIQAGADICATSIHKTGGSLTQSSVILAQGRRVDFTKLRSTLNILQSTSSSALLLASLDVARKTLHFEGQKRIEKIIEMAAKTRERLAEIPGLKVMDKEHLQETGRFSYDETKIVVKVSDLGLSGFEVFQKMRKKYNIQLELAETHSILCVLSMGTTKDDLENLCDAFEDLSRQFYKPHRRLGKIRFDYQLPEAYARPRDAYHAPKLYVSLQDSINEISAESIMIYPPGIPLVIPGELITEEVVNNINYYLKKGSTLLSDLEDGRVKIINKEKWIKYEGDIKE
ncbi:MAG: aminotransferase class I/II-fold pyridoxal phosphate-dependent enzyme [Bacilli bacterium]